MTNARSKTGGRKRRNHLPEHFRSIDEMELMMPVPVINEQRAAAWLDIQEIVGRNKLRPDEAEMSPEDEEDLILREIKAARAEERST